MVKKIIHAVKKFLGSKEECNDECCRPAKKSVCCDDCCTPAPKKTKKGKKK